MGKNGVSNIGVWLRLIWLRSMALAAGLLVICGPASALPAGAFDYRMGSRIFTSDDGLPQSGANTVLQTRDGYLWVGTFGGLARFDGLTFTIFRGKPAFDTSVSEGTPQTGPASDRVLTLYQDDRDWLWVGTQDAGLSVRRQGMFHHLPVCGGICQINDILQTPDRSLWIATSVGVLNLDPVHGRETWIGRGSIGYSRLARDSQGRIYVAGNEDFFVLVDRQLRRIPLPDGERRVPLLKASGSGLLVGTERALYRYDPAHGQWQPLGVAGPKAAATDADGRWWVATVSGHLFRETDSGQWRDVPELFGLGITDLAWDNEGNLWIGTGSKGLSRVRKPLFGLVSTLGWGMNMAGRAVIGDGRGGLWLGSACAGLWHRTPDGNMRRHPIQSGQGNGCVASLALDREDTLWVGTAEGRLVRVVHGKAEAVGAWSIGNPINVWLRGDRRFLVSSERSMFDVRTDGEGRIVGQQRIAALEGMNVNNIVPAARGGDWFVGDRGVWRVVDNRVVERWTPREGLSSRFARALYEDKETATLWVGLYGGGLNRIRNGQVSRYDSRNGLFDDTVSCILSDGRGRLWLGGNRGITLLPAPRQAATEIESIGYAASDGLIPSEINGGYSTACHRDTQGMLWFSLVEGFAVLDPADFPDVQPARLRPRIEGVAVSGRMQKIVGSSLALEPFARSVEIHYTAVNLSRPRETNFRFRLRGFDPDWVDAGQNRSILYPSIPWGEHVFEVQARTQGGQWSPLSARLKILNPQPWYLRTWILILATALSLLALVGGTQFGASQIGLGRGETPDK